jgi:recombination protein RecR
VQIPDTLLVAIDELSKLPSIGKKTAQRLALFLVKSDFDAVKKLADSLLDLKTKLKLCKRCFNLSENDFCSICTNPKREHSILCVVEDINDIVAIEKTNEFNGLYHVLGGVLSPLSGIGADDLKIKELISRFENESFKEIILALNPDTEGEATSLYLAKLLKPFGVKVSRIARGIPIGGNLEFTDEITIGKAFLNRIDL